MAGVIGLMFVVQMSPGTLPDVFGRHNTQYGQIWTTGRQLIHRPSISKTCLVFLNKKYIKINNKSFLYIHHVQQQQQCLIIIIDCIRKKRLAKHRK
jgi:hypothetical protein